nr:venom allergen 5-like [Parasteatoda tepidariorum]
MTDKQAEMDEIVNVHNQFRSTIAMGSETRGGGLPSASNMLQMTWDKELADIAQKWAWQCRYEHDCEICRATSQ